MAVSGGCPGTPTLQVLSRKPKGQKKVSSPRGGGAGLQKLPTAAGPGLHRELNLPTPRSAGSQRQDRFRQQHTFPLPTAGLLQLTGQLGLEQAASDQPERHPGGPQSPNLLRLKGGGGHSQTGLWGRADFLPAMLARGWGRGQGKGVLQGEGAESGPGQDRGARTLIFSTPEQQERVSCTPV